MTRVLAVASGKGGAGKTSVSVNLALALGRLGRWVCLLDADLGLSNVDVLLGINPTLTLEHVLFEGASMEDAVVNVAQGLDVVPGGSGVARLADLSRKRRLKMAEEFSKLAGYDYILVDNSPGISRQVLSLCQACPELLVVVNPEPASITDAYALIKVLAENGMRRSPYLLVNKATPEAAKDLFVRMRAVMRKHLKLDARFLGHVPQDAHMGAAAARQRPVVEIAPASPSGRSFLLAAKNLELAGPPQGLPRANPAEIMEGALVSMRQGLPPAKPAPPGLDRLLEQAAALADKLDGQESERLRLVLAEARDMLQPAPAEPRPAPAAKPEATRVRVISSDPSIGEILAESLGASGFLVDEGTGAADAAVVYWPADRNLPAPRLPDLMGRGYVYVRGLTSKDAPRFVPSPAEVMDMPFKLEDLAGAVRRAARRP